MKVSLHVYNPTPYVRTQWVLYGSQDPHNVFLNFPRSYINAAFVTVHPKQGDQVIEFDPDDRPIEKGLLSSAVKKTLSETFQPHLMINGEKHHFFLSVVTDLTKDFTVAEWHLKGSDIVARLWTYYGRQDDIMRFEMSYFAESLNVTRKHYKISMGVDSLAVIIKSSGKKRDHHEHLLDGLMVDASGQRLLGSFIFHRDVFSSGTRRRDTMLAEDIYPLYALHEWQSWGPWRKQPVRISNEEFERQLKNKASNRWQDPFMWPGYILNKNPGDTGAQSGFGTWQHMATIGARRSEEMLLNQLIAAQESCRPIHFFEEGGLDLDLKNHPDFVPWDERPHYSEVVSPDRLRRKHGWDLNSRFDWFGHDRQHHGNIWLAEDVLLNGSYASAWELKRKADLMIAGLTLKSKKPRWSTNNGLSGRDGRMLLSATYNWMATGNKQLLDHLVKRFNENIKPDFTPEASPGPLHVSRVIWNDDRVFGKDKAGWIVWEDALMVMGLDAISSAFADAGMRAEAADADRIVGMIAKTVADHGWHPTRNIIAKAILWKDKNTQPLSAAEWDDEKKVLLATGTDYDIWAIPCLEIAMRHGSTRAKTLLASIKIDHDNPIHHVYLGAR